MRSAPRTVGTTGATMPDVEKYEIRRGSFSWALEEMKRGRRLRREGWTDKSVWVRYVGHAAVSGATFEGELGTYHWQSHLALKTLTDTFVPWTPTQTDILATDWEHND